MVSPQAVAAYLGGCQYGDRGHLSTGYSAGERDRARWIITLDDSYLVDIRCTGGMVGDHSAPSLRALERAPRFLRLVGTGI